MDGKEIQSRALYLGGDILLAVTPEICSFLITREL